MGSLASVQPAARLGCVGRQERGAEAEPAEGKFLRGASLGVKKAAVSAGWIGSPAVETLYQLISLQPCGKEPLLKTRGIAFQPSPVPSAGENTAALDNFTQFALSGHGFREGVHAKGLPRWAP